MNILKVGMADCAWSDEIETMLVTYALGSCLAVSIYDPLAQVGGLLHLMLPEIGSERLRSGANPFMFADTGLPLLLQRAGELGAQKRRLVVCLAGGAQMMDQNGIFNIGRRNHAAVRKFLWSAGLFVSAEAVGGGVSRTLGLELKTGRSWVREQGIKERELFSPLVLRSK